MRYHLFLNETDPEKIHAAFLEAKLDCVDYVFLSMGTGWTACRARLKHEDALENLEAKGWVTWDHITDHTAALEDRHHVGIVDASAGIVSGDTPLAAAKKLYLHLGKYRPFRPVMIF
jgi:hypothetical protein